MKCEFCGKNYETNNSLKNHVIRCAQNPNKLKKEVCKFDKCNRFCKSYGYCTGHARQKELCKELRPLRQDVPVQDKYNKMVVIPEDCNSCYGWTGPIYKRRSGSVGYAHFCHDSKNVWAHRFSWEQYNCKKIPEGMNIDHLCRNTICTNPLHLELTSPGENNKRMKAYRNLISQIKFLETICVKYNIDLKKEGYANVLANE